jgi:hypothetical protein
MNAIPPVLDARQVEANEGGKRYPCPLCSVQTTADAADTGWVKCPLVGHRPICLGCCLDHQKVARHQGSEPHPFTDLFDTLAGKVGRPIRDLMLECLTHQCAILVPQTSPAAVALLRHVDEAIGAASGRPQ